LWDGRTAEQRRETVRHEALVNQEFSGLPMVIMCAYPAALTDVAAVAEFTHPVLIRDGTRRPSTNYDAGTMFPQGYDEPLEAVPGDAATLAYRDNPRAVRAFAAKHARCAGMAMERIKDLIIAVGELDANTCRHTTGGGVLWVWVAGQELICQLRDSGHIADPLRAATRPRPAAPEAWGCGGTPALRSRRDPHCRWRYLDPPAHAAGW
jgi:hypothetical protein